MNPLLCVLRATRHDAPSAVIDLSRRLPDNFTIHKEFVSSKVAGDTASLTDPALAHVHFDISWDEVAKYAVSSQMRVSDLWNPIWAKLTPAASRKVRLGTYERLFDAARRNVRAWEAANGKS